MIRALRQRHRHVIFALGVFVPVAFGVGLCERAPVPVMPGFPPGLHLAPPAVTPTGWCRTNLFSKFPITVRQLRENPPTLRVAVAFTAAPDFLQPDLLVYWQPGSPILADALPDGATLAGGFDAPVLFLPAEAGTRPGFFVLYSLANNKIVDVSRPTIIGEASP